MVWIYMLVLLGFSVYALWKLAQEGDKRTILLYLCFALLAAAAGVGLGLAPDTFGLVG